MSIRKEKGARLVVGTDWVPIEFVSDPFITVTFRGYAVAIQIKVIATQLEYTLLLGAKSLSDPLENLREQSGGVLTGQRCAIRKTGPERTAAYEVREIGK